MASTLLAAVKSAPKPRSGAKRWEHFRTPQQLTEYRKLLEWARENESRLGIDLPSCNAICRIVEEQFGCKLCLSVFKRHLREGV